MLTVKHIGTDGTETIIEAERVERVQTGDHFMDGIYLDREPASDQNDAQSGEPSDIQRAAVPGRAFKECYRFAHARSTADTTPVVYVMNRFGATVAMYRL